MPEADQESNLIRLIAAGDESALHELYARCGQRLYAFALRLTGDPAIAEDVVQDALVVAWQSAENFRGESKVTTWLLGIVHNIAMKTLRHRSQPITPLMEGALTDPGLSPEESARTAERTLLVKRALQTLSPQHRAVLELVFYQDLSLEEAARVCRCPVGTVKSRLSFARKHLRGVLERMGSNVEDWR
jgi:RNA polymerase sigma-70 factor (ECF subfamily)